LGRKKYAWKDTLQNEYVPEGIRARGNENSRNGWEVQTRALTKKDNRSKKACLGEEIIG